MIKKLLFGIFFFSTDKKEKKLILCNWNFVSAFKCINLDQLLSQIIKFCNLNDKKSDKFSFIVCQNSKVYTIFNDACIPFLHFVYQKFLLSFISALSNAEFSAPQKTWSLSLRKYIACRTRGSPPKIKLFLQRVKRSTRTYLLLWTSDF